MATRGLTSIAVSVTYADGRPRFSVDCVGLSAKDLEWAIDVVARIQRDTTNTKHYTSWHRYPGGNPLVSEAFTMLQYQ